MLATAVGSGTVGSTGGLASTGVPVLQLSLWALLIAGAGTLLVTVNRRHGGQLPSRG